MRRSSWIIRVSPKSNDKCSYERHERDSHRDVGDMKTEVEIGLTWL